MIIKCAICNKDFYIKPSRFKKQKTHCCGLQCANELRKITLLGENNPNFGNIGHKNKLFKNYEKITNYGYRKIYTPEHPLCDHAGRVFEHRLVVESSENYKEFLEDINGYLVLPRKYDVHHVDYDKLNNNIENLIVLTKKEHTKLHKKDFDIVRDKINGRILSTIKKENVNNDKNKTE